MDTFLIFLYASAPFWLVLFLAFRQRKRNKENLRYIIDTFETSESLVYPHMRMYYKNFQPPVFNKGDSLFYYRFNHCRLIANPHELIIVGLNGWNNNRLATPSIFVKSHVPSNIPAGTNLFTCDSIAVEGTDIHIVFHDRMRVPKPITLVIKRVDEPLRKHLLEAFS